MAPEDLYDITYNTKMATKQSSKLKKSNIINDAIILPTKRTTFPYQRNI